MAIEHMLATQSSSTKCLPYSCFLMKIFQYFVLNLFGVGDHIGPGKIHNQHTVKRIGFERNEEDLFVRGGQDDNDEDDDDDEENEEQEGMNVDEEESDTESEEETHRKEQRQKKRQKRMEEGSSSESMTQLTEMIASLQVSMNSRFDNLDGKISYTQERVMRLEERDRGKGEIVSTKAIIAYDNKRSIFGVSMLHYIKAKNLDDQGIMMKKRSSHSKIKAESNH
ncbi:hypothetical protein M9H77_07505 [Catharanthus roseus]|uniref:Uncharacterized protein n=1 Tax=Catharanthus roseus TaxID=4058 RepID=A0ACC0BV62_CATRO|nr:hypothetical protein M9H77_07505 [Catharanthus roseus]